MLYNVILNRIKTKINRTRFESGLSPLCGENLNCIAYRNIHVLIQIISRGSPEIRNKLERIFNKSIPDISLLFSQTKLEDEKNEIQSFYHEELKILKEFVELNEQNLSFGQVCKELEKKYTTDSK